MTTRSKHQATVRLLKRLVPLWRQRLWLAHWNIDVVYEWNGIGDADSPRQVRGEANADWRYLTGCVRFAVPALSVCSPAEIERTVVHELMHLVVNELREGDVKHEERVVTMLTSVLLGLAPQPRRKP